jgi:hypothetical protein
MRRLYACAILMAATASLASAGEVLGKITAAALPSPTPATVAAKCGGKDYPAVKTDKSGSYHLVLAETGKCTLTVGYKGQTATIDVASYDDAAQADLVLGEQGRQAERPAEVDGRRSRGRGGRRTSGTRSASSSTPWADCSRRCPWPTWA